MVMPTKRSQGSAGLRGEMVYVRTHAVQAVHASQHSRSHLLQQAADFILRGRCSLPLLSGGFAAGSALADLLRSEGTQSPEPLGRGGALQWDHWPLPSRVATSSTRAARELLRRLARSRYSRASASVARPAKTLRSNGTSSRRSCSARSEYGDSRPKSSESAASSPLPYTMRRYSVSSTTSGPRRSSGPGSRISPPGSAAWQMYGLWLVTMNWIRGKC